MTSFDAGSAHSSYVLDLTDFQKSVATVKQSYAELERLRKGMGTPTVPPIKQPTLPGGGGNTPNIAAQERQILALARAQASLAQSSGDLTGAERILSTALSQVDRSTVSAIRAETQLVGVQNRLSAGANTAAGRLQVLPRTIAGLSNEAKSFASGFAASVGVVSAGQAIFDRAREGFNLVSALDLNRRALGQFVGSQREANDILQRGIGFGQQYGLTQRQISDAISSSANLIKGSKQPIESILGTFLQLQSRNPAKTFDEVRFSINELASGDYASIADVFNIPKAAARQLRDEVANGKDVFVALQSYLTSQGNTLDQVKVRTDGAAGAALRYEQAQERLSIALGNLATGPGVKVLDFLAFVIDRTTRAITVTDQLRDAGTQAFSGAAGYDDYKKRVDFVNDQAKQLNVTRGSTLSPRTTGPEPIVALTRAQFEYAQELAKTGVGFDEAEKRARTFGTGLDAITEAQRRLGGSGATDAQQRLIASMDQLARSGDAGERQVASLSIAYNGGSFSAQQFQAALDVLIARHEAAAAAAAKATGATQQQTTELGKNAIAAQEDAEKSDKLKMVQAEIERISRLVAAGLIESGDAAEYMRKFYGLALPETEQLIDAQNRLADAKLRAANALNAVEVQGTIDKNRAAGHTGRGDSSDADELGEAYERIAKERAAAQLAQQIALENTAQRVTRLRGELAALTPGTVAFIEKQTEILLAERALAAERAALAKAGGKRINQQASLNDRLANQEQDLQNRVATIQREAYEKQLDAQEQFNRDRARSNEDYAIAARRSAEDEQRKERKLLAEGKILEARQAREDFEREQRRNAEDQVRKNQRAQQDYADARRRDQRELGEQIDDAQGRTATQQERTARTGERKGLDARGVDTNRDTQGVVADRPLNTGPVVVPGVPVAQTVAALAPRQLAITIRNALYLDKQQLIATIGPPIVEMADEMIANELAVQSIADAPGLQQASVREVR